MPFLRTDLSDREFALRSSRYTQYIAAVLIFLTAVLLVWHHFGMEKVVVLSRYAGPHPLAIDDRSTQGASVATAERRASDILLRCKLVKQYEWPFCIYAFYVGNADIGLDLSSFDSISVDLGMKGPTLRLLRLYIRNFEPGISVVGDQSTLKINEIEFAVPEKGIVKIPVKVLHIAHWWAAERTLPMLNMDSRIDNVISIELTMATHPGAGEYDMAFRSIKFHGKIIDQNHLLMLLVGMWIVFALAGPVSRNYHLRKQLASSKAKLKVLSYLNDALQLEARELADQAHTDPLTGALNRQGLRSALLEEWQASSGRDNLPLSVVFFDLDHFKQVNDVHGHETGDKVLRQFAITVRAELRGSDKFVRWGGEEFLIVCQDTNAEQARQLCEKLRTAAGRQEWPCGLKVTASFGVAARSVNEDIGGVIKRADTALYDAKQSGRDCVKIARAQLQHEAA